MKIDMYDALMISFCFFLTLSFGVFFGHEINVIEQDARIRHAKKIINDCNYKKMAGVK